MSQTIRAIAPGAVHLALLTLLSLQTSPALAQEASDDLPVPPVAVDPYRDEAELDGAALQADPPLNTDQSPAQGAAIEPSAQPPDQEPASANPDPATEPKTRAPASPPAEQPDSSGVPDWLFDPSVQVGLFTTAGGVLGGTGICAAAFFSPACCGILLGLPFGAIGTALGALIGVAIADDWSCGAMILPTLGSLAIGAVAGLGASIAAVAVAQAIGSNFNVITTDPRRATITQWSIAAIAAGSAMATMTLGAAVAGLGAGMVHKLQSSPKHKQISSARDRQHPPARQVAMSAMAY